QVEVYPTVDAPLTKVAVERSVIAVPLEQRTHGAQIVPEPLRRDGRILPPGPASSLSRHDGRHPERGITHRPDPRCFAWITAVSHGGRARLSAKPRHETARLRIGFLRRIRAVLHEQPAPALRQQLDILRMKSGLSHVVHQLRAESLEPD